MTQAERSELINVLQDFGLNLVQSKVYLGLLSLGATTAGPLVRKTSLHRQLVYSALEILESEGYVSHVTKNNRKVFSARRPEFLLEKQSLRTRKLQLSIPKLQKLIPQGSSKLHVEVLTGREEFLRRIFTMVDSAANGDGVLRMIANVRDVDVYAVLGSDYEDYRKYLLEKKVKKQLIAPASSISAAYPDRLVKEKGSELRISPSALSMPTSTLFTNEVVALDIFSEEIISVMIWNTTVAKSFKSHFDILWKTAVTYKTYIKENQIL